MIFTCQKKDLVQGFEIVNDIVEKNSPIQLYSYYMFKTIEENNIVWCLSELSLKQLKEISSDIADKLQPLKNIDFSSEEELKKQIYLNLEPEEYEDYVEEIVAVRQGIIMIAVTDSIMLATTYIKADIKEHGSIMMSEKIIDIVKIVEDKPVAFAKNENNWMSIKCSKYKGKIAALSADNFPDIPKVSKENYLAYFSSTQTEELFNKLLSTACYDGAKNTLHGVSIIFEQDFSYFASADGHRLTTFKIVNYSHQREEDFSESAFIPIKLALKIKKLCGNSKDDLFFTIADNKIYINTGISLICSNLIDFRFPRYREDFLPIKDKGNRFTFTVNKNTLKDVINRVSVLLGSSNCVFFKVEKELITIQGKEGEFGTSVEEIECRATLENNEKYETGFNPKYIIDYMNMIPDGEVTFCLDKDNPIGGVFIETKELEGFVSMVMPLNLKK